MQGIPCEFYVVFGGTSVLKACKFDNFNTVASLTIKKKEKIKSRSIEFPSFDLNRFIIFFTFTDIFPSNKEKQFDKYFPFKRDTRQMKSSGKIPQKMQSKLPKSKQFCRSTEKREKTLKINYATNEANIWLSL